MRSERLGNRERLLKMGQGSSLDWGMPRAEVLEWRRNLKGGAGVRRRAVRSRRVLLDERAREAIAGFAAVVPAAKRVGAVFCTGRGKGGAMNRSQAFRIMVGLAQE